MAAAQAMPMPGATRPSNQSSSYNTSGHSAPMLGMVTSKGGGRKPTSRIIFDKVHSTLLFSHLLLSIKQYDKDESGFIDAEEFKFMCMDLGLRYLFATTS